MAMAVTQNVLYQNEAARGCSGLDENKGEQGSCERRFRVSSDRRRHDSARRLGMGALLVLSRGSVVEGCRERAKEREKQRNRGEGGEADSGVREIECRVNLGGN